MRYCRLVQHEVGDLLARRIVVSHLVEQRLAEAGALDGFQELLRDDHVGVDVAYRQGRRDSGQNRKFVHRSLQVFRRAAYLRAPGNSPPPRSSRRACRNAPNSTNRGFKIEGLQMFKPPFNASLLAPVKLILKRGHDGFDVTGNAAKLAGRRQQGGAVVRAAFERRQRRRSASERCGDFLGIKRHLFPAEAVEARSQRQSTVNRCRQIG